MTDTKAMGPDKIANFRAGRAKVAKGQLIEYLNDRLKEKFSPNEIIINESSNNSITDRIRDLVVEEFKSAGWTVKWLYHAPTAQNNLTQIEWRFKSPANFVYPPIW